MRRRITMLFWWLILIALAVGLALPPQPIRIHDHPGGSVTGVAEAVASAGISGRRVEITGGCWSSCTMYLGLQDVCVDPTAKFGFHGPSSPLYGIGLPPREFEAASQFMATHYPGPLRRWFLSEGRMLTVGFTVKTGADLIAMGSARQCR
ncbi:hypothetical protein [Phaeovulum sp. W22_SRMD_FR3]|uniref:hypothetical protein n=1 Tax=Phaeovulum sp. W22_SRMD_FR3 TaxID=3240274 RepID=UPI003F98DA5D